LTTGLSVASSIGRLVRPFRPSKSHLRQRLLGLDDTPSRAADLAALLLLPAGSFDVGPPQVVRLGELGFRGL